ncbi:hypothetical protein [Amycolatopsis sp. NPDC003861]
MRASERPPIAESSDRLRARIPGWGADLGPADRPSVPKLQWQADRGGAHWDFPERQPEKWPRERPIEHAVRKLVRRRSSSTAARWSAKG